AFDAWASAKNRPMAEILAAEAALDEAGQALLAEKAASFLRYPDDDPERGQLSSGAGRVVPEGPIGRAASGLSATITHVAARLVVERGDDDQVSGSAHGGAAGLGSSERFRIVRPHARGGLGEVFLALDPELDRHVAVKELQVDYAFDPVSQSRFLL